MYTLRPAVFFERQYKKIIKHNEILRSKVEKTFLLLKENPLHTSLRTRKVSTPSHGVRYSSRVTGDIRIIWDYDSSDELVILLLDIGGHSGSRKVYK